MYTPFKRSRRALILRSTSSSADTQFPCEACSKIFDTQRKRRYVCFLRRPCGSMSLMGSSNHVLSVHNKRFVCHVPRCPLQGQPFGFRADLKRHRQSAHSERQQQPQLPCPVVGCQAMLSRRKDNARRHLTKTHGLNVNTAETHLVS